MTIDSEYLKMCETLILKTKISLGDYVHTKNNTTEDTGIVIQCGKGSLIEVRTLTHGVNSTVAKEDVFPVYRIGYMLGLVMDKLNTIHPLHVWKALEETIGKDADQYFSRFNTLEKLLMAVVAKRLFNRVWINGAWK